MYIDGYIERIKGQEILKVAERVNGQRILKELNPVFEYYVESPQGTYKTINGTLAIKKEFQKGSELRKSLETEYNKTYEARQNVTFKTLSKHYMGKPAPEMNVLFFDIETDFHEKYGYSSPNDAFNRVTAISLYQSWTGKDYVLTLPPKDMPVYQAQEIINNINEEFNEPNSTVILFTEETEMFELFFELMNEADVLSGWNSEFFDIPYMVNRTEKIFHKDKTALWCLWNKKPRAKEADMYGKTVITYDLIGRVHMDYLALYKKHAPQVEQSYTLDYIGEKVTGEHKVHYEGSLDKLYKEDYRTFLLYSKQDSILLKKIDAKLDYINLHNRLAHNECVLLSTTMGTVALVDTAIINLAHKRGEVVFDKEVETQDEYEELDVPEEELESKAAGAWVQDPVLGLVEDLGCVDFNSLYPTVLRTLGMSTETIVGQVRQDYTEAVLNSRIKEQKDRYKGKNFEPDWTAAWHNLFSAVEYTMIHDKTDDILNVDLEDGSTFSCTAKELYDTIFNPDSSIVISANGTLFDKSKSGIIPEILTMWYSERKAQQKMVLDYKHLCSDGWELSSEEFSTVQYEANKLNIANSVYFKTNLHHEDPVYLIRCSLQKKDYAEVAKIVVENGLVLKDNHIFAPEELFQYCNDQSAFWKQNQQIRKILLNSLYGALLNSKSTFYDKRLGQSVTLTGRTMTKHMASKINEICTDNYACEGGVVIYGDSVTADALIDVIINDEPKQIPVEELYKMFIETSYHDKEDKEYVIPDILVKTFSTKEDVVYYDKAKTIMRHLNNNPIYELSTETSKVKVTQDHSVVAEIDGELGEFTPEEIQECIDSGCDVYLIVSKDV